MPSASPDELARAIIDCLAAGANVVNLSLALAHPSLNAERALQAALDEALRRGVMIVAAAGNQGGGRQLRHHPPSLGHPGGCKRPQRTTARRVQSLPLDRPQGLSAPGDRITSLGAAGEPLTFGGTSAAALFATGTAALLWSEFPAASAAQVKYALVAASRARRASLAPPLLDAWAAYRTLASLQGVRRAS